MSETEKDGQNQKPKLCWMAVASPILAILAICGAFLSAGSNLGYNVFLYSVLFGIVLGLIAFWRICQSQGKIYGRKYAISGIALAILLIVSAIDVVTGDTVARAKAILISSSIKLYLINNDGNLPADNDFEALGLEDLEATHLNKNIDYTYSFTIHSRNPLRFTITAKNKNLEPSVITFDQDGNWTEKTE